MSNQSRDMERYPVAHVDGTHFELEKLTAKIMLQGKVSMRNKVLAGYFE